MVKPVQIFLVIISSSKLKDIIMRKRGKKEKHEIQSKKYTLLPKEKLKICCQLGKIGTLWRLVGSKSSRSYWKNIMMVENNGNKERRLVVEISWMAPLYWTLILLWGCHISLKWNWSNWYWCHWWCKCSIKKNHWYFIFRE